ncbi:hypothetical protein [Microbacterium stercoris]|uniref:Uncharacterized protein n=1 Tax=Microbacterium stercoris TaxID=2820289 RepID=A0A939TPZ7_9MICO|nr:hypothetical protein [Microbacterium stercoris]MBO3662611.1 hypothetical protein [Microbacterium stercoris]
MFAMRIATDVWRIVSHRWMPLLSWWIAGVVLRDLILHAAAQVAGFSPWVAVFVVALAMLIRLIAFVAMLMVVRDELDGLADPHPPGIGEFLRAVLGAAGPFAVFYYVSGLLEQDWRSYIELAGDAHLGTWLATGETPDLGVIGFNLPTAAVIVVCLGLRIAWGRAQSRLVWWLAAVAVLLEVLWVFFTEYAFDDALGLVGGWLEGRQVGVWLTDARAALAEWAAPLAVVWDAISPVVAILFEALFVPIAWMLAAATVYGRAIADDDAPRARVSAGRRIGDAVVGEVVDQTDTLRDAFRLMRRTGPLLIATYCLVYALVGLFEPVVLWVASRLVGPHGREGLLHAALPALTLIPTLIVTPLLTALVAAACNAAVARFAPGSLVAEEDGSGSGGPVDDEAQLLAPVVSRDVDRDEQVVGDVAGHEEERPQLSGG